jgi:hypothetical protein
VHGLITDRCPTREPEAERHDSHTAPRHTNEPTVRVIFLSGQPSQCTTPVIHGRIGAVGRNREGLQKRAPLFEAHLRFESTVGWTDGEAGQWVEKEVSG